MRNLLYLKEIIKLFLYKGKYDVEFKDNVYCVKVYYLEYKSSLIFLLIENQTIFMLKFALLIFLLKYECLPTTINLKNVYLHKMNYKLNFYKLLAVEILFLLCGNLKS